MRQACAYSIPGLNMPRRFPHGGDQDRILFGVMVEYLYRQDFLAFFGQRPSSRGERFQLYPVLRTARCMDEGQACAAG
jgi:hypothetical protein